MLELKKLNDSIVVLSKDLNSRHTVPVVNNISNNKIFNINVFLNETCKNAINLDSFVSDDAGMRHFQFLDVQKPQHHTQSTGWFLFEYWTGLHYFIFLPEQPDSNWYLGQWKVGINAAVVQFCKWMQSPFSTESIIMQFKIVLHLTVIFAVYINIDMYVFRNIVTSTGYAPESRTRTPFILYKIHIFDTNEYAG